MLSWGKSLIPRFYMERNPRKRRKRNRIKEVEDNKNNEFGSKLKFKFLVNI